MYSSSYLFSYSFIYFNVLVSTTPFRFLGSTKLLNIEDHKAYQNYFFFDHPCIIIDSFLFVINVIKIFSNWIVDWSLINEIIIVLGFYLSMLLTTSTMKLILCIWSFGVLFCNVLQSFFPSVLVHSGGVHGGHYYAFIRPTLSEQWYVMVLRELCYSLPFELACVCA